MHHLLNEVLENRGERIRASCDVNHDKLYGCDVCWTCRFFDEISGKCDVVKCPPESSLEIIEDPVWFRCSHWRENK